MIRAIVSLASAAVVLASSGRHVPEANLLRGYAFAACLAEGYRGTSFAEDADRVADIYMAAGKTTTPAMYQKLRQVAKDAQPEKPAVVDNANLATMVCLELYESKSLRAMVARKLSTKKRFESCNSGNHGPSNTPRKRSGSCLTRTPTR